ncbi:MAG TPA: hypothetical protein PLL20_10750 [Phycisphaerae bacterium]|nr:hypothetical protein [Phycisphaerae bacterium]
MNEHLLHQLAKEVLLFCVLRRSQDLLEVRQGLPQELAVQFRQAQPFAPLLEVRPFSLQLGQLFFEIADLSVAGVGIEFARLEGLQIALHAGPHVGHVRLHPADVLREVRLLGVEPPVGLRPDTRHEVLVLEHGLDVLDDGRLQEVRPNVVLVAVVRREPLGAHVVRDAARVLLPVATDADHRPSAPLALHQAGQQPRAVVPPPAAHVLPPLVQNFLGLVEEHLGHDAVVVAFIDDFAPAEFADVDGVPQDVDDDPLVPLLAAAPAAAGTVELLADGLGAFLAERVHREHLLHDERFFLAEDKPLLRFEPVSVGHHAAHEVAALGLLLHADLGALDDGRVLEFGEDAEHLEHHLPGGVGCVERLGDALEDDVLLGQLIHHLGELADLAAEPVHAEDQQHVERLDRGVVEHLLQAGPVHVRAALGVAVDLVERPVVAVLTLAVGIKPVLLGVERVLLVVFVGADPRVERYSRHRATFS